MNNELPESSESSAKAVLDDLVSAWNRSSFEDYCGHFTQSLTDHYNPGYFSRIRTQCGQWMSNKYLGSLKQGRNYVHLWQSRFESSENDVLFSLTLNSEGQIAGLLKRFSRV